MHYHSYLLNQVGSYANLCSTLTFYHGSIQEGTSTKICFVTVRLLHPTNKLQKWRKQGKVFLIWDCFEDVLKLGHMTMNTETYWRDLSLWKLAQPMMKDNNSEASTDKDTMIYKLLWTMLSFVSSSTQRIGKQLGILFSKKSKVMMDKLCSIWRMKSTAFITMGNSLAILLANLKVCVMIWRLST